LALDDVEATVVQVDDPLRALHRVAASWRRRFDPLVVGVTGSIAKTSTKEAIATVLASELVTLKNEGNQNNEIGLPLTVLRLRPDHQAAVLEMGMYVGGEIAELAAIGRPRDRRRDRRPAVHLSRIGTIEGDRAGEGRARRGAAAGRCRDPQRRRRAGPPDEARTDARVMTYGFAPDAMVAPTVRSAGADGMRFDLVADGQRRPVTIPALGRLRGPQRARRRRRSGLASRVPTDRIAAARDGLVGAASRRAHPSGWRDDRG
jgi:UDP-N-acetylmuramoyl-tripeptide--D-alanyl-D-alanine ligase